MLVGQHTEITLWQAGDMTAGQWETERCHTGYRRTEAGRYQHIRLAADCITTKPNTFSHSQHVCCVKPQGSDQIFSWPGLAVSCMQWSVPSTWHRQLSPPAADQFSSVLTPPPHNSHQLQEQTLSAAARPPYHCSESLVTLGFRRQFFSLYSFVS